MTDEVRNSFGLPEDVANSFEIPDYGNSFEPVTVTASLITHFAPVTDNLFRFDMIEDPENECLYDHFDRFNSTDNGTETFCYYLDEERSYDDANEACAYHEHHSYYILYKEFYQFRLAEGKTYSKMTSK